MRQLLLRWSRHKCREIPHYSPVQYDLPCRCGWRVTGIVYADTEGIRRQDLSGPAMTLLDHYDACPKRSHP